MHKHNAQNGTDIYTKPSLSGLEFMKNVPFKYLMMIVSQFHGNDILTGDMADNKKPATAER